ncbi:MAG TPA: UDP-N-acetylmuramoyl-L-alanyl-D-glutamate--2,6-diaminopimelate ligase [Frankiaceae bacterium]
MTTANGPGGLRPAHAVARDLADVLGAAGVAPLGAPPAGVRVTGVTHDSRAVRAGDLYAALPGARVHGARFAAQAAASGAVALLTDPEGAELLAQQARAASGGRHPADPDDPDPEDEEDGDPEPDAPGGLPVVVVRDPRACLGAVASAVYGDPSSKLLLLGVTGTNGKTTSAYLLEAGLRAAGHETGIIGTIETRFAGTSLPSARTTPEAPDLQALLAVMVERGVTAVAMEVSSHALAQGRVAGATFAVAAFTNLSQDHLDWHPDMAAYFEAKASLFAPGFARVAVVCTDDDWGRKLAARLAEEGRPPITWALDGPADWTVAAVRPSPSGTRFEAHGPAGALDVSVPMPARYNMSNALGALAVLTAAGVPPTAAVRGIAQLPGVPGRMERVEAGQPYAAIVDYAHTPDAVASVLAALRETTPGRLVVVLGCGGDRDAGKRPLMGRAAADGADLAVLTSDNPRGEDPDAILAAVRAGVPEGASVIVEPDRAKAIALAVQGLGAGDTVLVAGKGHETGQDLGDRVLPFDDRAVLRRAVQQRGELCG